MAYPRDVMAYGLVMLTELLNTALEKMIDRISLAHHALSKIVKDIASGAVFIASVMCALVWGVCQK